MPSRSFSRAPLDFGDLRRDLQVPGEFSAGALAQAETAAQTPDLSAQDRRDIPFVTVDPAGSRDLDQAMHIAAQGDEFLVSYAIADVAAFVSAGSTLDDEVRTRGETLYFPDVRVPLHPPVLSEGAASLLPGQASPAVLWQIGLDADGEVVSTTVGRAVVSSRQQLDYESLQVMMDTGHAPDAIALLAKVGPARMALARRRHAINLDLPEQQVDPDGHGGWQLALRTSLPVEQWNAEISLLTGMCAAQLMMSHGIGILRTLPAPDDRSVQRLRRLAPSLDVVWPDGQSPGDVLAGLDRSNARHVAFIEQAASLLRGAGYTPFDGALPDHTEHAGVGAPYAHVTAPLRRLVDRFASSLCVALGGTASTDGADAVPAWIREALPTLPEVMQAADQRAHTVDRAVVDMVEAWLLADRIGEEFSAVVVDAQPTSAKIVIADPAVRATCHGPGLVEGSTIQVRLTAADVAARTVTFEPAQLPSNS